MSLLEEAMGEKSISSFNEVRGCDEVSTRAWVKEGGVLVCRDKCLSGVGAGREGGRLSLRREPKFLERAFSEKKQDVENVHFQLPRSVI